MSVSSNQYGDPHTHYTSYKPFMSDIKLDRSNNIIGIRDDTMMVHHKTIGSELFLDSCLDFDITDNHIYCLNEEKRIYKYPLPG